MNAVSRSVTGRYGGAVLNAPRARLTAVAVRLPSRFRSMEEIRAGIAEACASRRPACRRTSRAGHLVMDDAGGQLGARIRDFALPEPLRGQ